MLSHRTLAALAMLYNRFGNSPFRTRDIDNSLRRNLYHGNAISPMPGTDTNQLDGEYYIPHSVADFYDLQRG